MKINRSYLLQISANKSKLEEVRYSSSRYLIFLNHFKTQLYFSPNIPYLSTYGMSKLANIAQRKAIGIIRAIRAKNEKSNCPEIKFKICPASLEKSKDSSFDYWVKVPSQWKNVILIPAKSHWKLNEKIKDGWLISDYCELTQNKNNKWFVRVFVSKNITTPKAKINSLGVDVGISHGVARSDKYLGKSLYNIMSTERLKQSERLRQKHTKKPFKTILKQQLDKEVNRALVRCQINSWNLIVENPKVLSNLRIDRWARSYFANRASEKSKELGVYVLWVNPAYTSITCSICGVQDKRSRVKRAFFKCISCRGELHADYNAAVNIARKGQESLIRKKKAINPLRSFENLTV